MSINGSIFNPVFDKAASYSGTKFMMIEKRYDKDLFSVFLVLFFLSSGCAKKTVIVLLPNPDGKIGSVTVSTDAGSTNIIQTREITEVKGRESLPTSPKILKSIDNRNFQKISAICHSDTAGNPAI